MINQPINDPATNQVIAHATSMPRNTQSKVTLLMAVPLVLLVGVSAFLGWKVYDVESRTATSSSNAAASASLTGTEGIQSSFRLDYTPAGGGGSQSKQASLTLNTPRILRTQITNNSCSNGDQGGPGTGLLAECFTLSFANTLGASNSPESGGQLAVWDAYNWLQTDEDPAIPFPAFGLSTKTEKQAAWQTLTTLTPTSNLSSVFQKLPTLAIDAAYVGGPQHLTYVTTADGNLRGVVFVATAAQDIAYDPSVWFELGGTVSGQPVLITGSCKASDTTALRIQQLEKQQVSVSGQAEQLTTDAIKSLSAGKLSPQTSDALNQVTAMLKSIHLSAN